MSEIYSCVDFFPNPLNIGLKKKENGRVEETTESTDFSLSSVRCSDAYVNSQVFRSVSQTSLVLPLSVPSFCLIGRERGENPKLGVLPSLVMT